jgi:hypothetical protein
MSTSSISKTAYRTRKAFESRTVSDKFLAKLYGKYADVEDVFSFVQKAKDLFPLGNCGLATLYLKEKIGGEIVRGKYGGHNHTFLRIGETIVDITADQFGGQKVYIGPLQAPWSLAND